MRQIWVQRAFEELGYTARRTAKGGVLVDLGGRGEGLLLEAHADTLGGMVAEVEDSGRLRLTPLGGMRAENGEAENVRVYTRGGRVLEGTFQLCNASIHVEPASTATRKRTFDSCEVVLDEDVKPAEETPHAGDRGGGRGVLRAPHPSHRLRLYQEPLSGRQAVAWASCWVWPSTLRSTGTAPQRHVSPPCDGVRGGGPRRRPPMSRQGVTEAISVDMGCVGEGLALHRAAGIHLRQGLRRPRTAMRWWASLSMLPAAPAADYAVDVYPHYGSDAEAGPVGGP